MSKTNYALEFCSQTTARPIDLPTALASHRIKFQNLWICWGLFLSSWFKYRMFPPELNSNIVQLQKFFVREVDLRSGIFWTYATPNFGRQKFPSLIVHEADVIYLQDFATNTIFYNFFTFSSPPLLQTFFRESAQLTVTRHLTLQILLNCLTGQWSTFPWYRKV